MAKKGLKTILRGQSYTMSYLITMLINMISVSTTAGITMQLQIESIQGFILFVILFTLLDTMTDLLIKRYFYKYIFQSFGLILALAGMILIFTTERLVPDVYFETVYGIIGFTVFFLVIRFLLIYTYQRTFGKKESV